MVKLIRPSSPLLFEGMAKILETSIFKNKKERRRGRNSTKYKKEVVEYLKFVYKHSELKLYCFVSAFIYLHRLVWTPATKDPPETRKVFVLTRSNWMVLVTTAIMIAQKFNDDDKYLNIDFIKLCPNYDLHQLNKMEVDFLVGLNWDCSFTRQEYDAYYKWIAEKGKMIVREQT